MANLRVLGQCPACGGNLTVRRLQCVNCDTAVEGSFTLTRFDLLMPEQIAFLELFLKARGNIREVERAMGLSYPAVRSRLDQVLRALNLDTDNENRHAEQLRVLDAVKRGELSVDQAADELNRR